MLHKSIFARVALAAALTAGSFANASGFEKSIMFGGKSAGLAGIATPNAQGSDALYFNPAGLARDKEGQDVSLNISPTIPTWKAPISADNVQSTSKSPVIVPLALMYNRSINDRLGLGIGYYVSGGSEAEYSDIGITGLKGNFEAKSKLVVSEVGVGAGYKINDDFKIGLSYRIVMVKGDFALLQPLGVGQMGNVFLKDLSDTNFLAFKLGAQYRIAEKTWLGFTYRSNVPVSAKGTSGVDVHTTAGVANGGENSIKAKTAFPDAYTLGVKHQLNDFWNLYGEYVFTAYGRLQNVQVEGKVGSLVNPAIQLGWRDQHNVRLAAEYTGFKLPIRYGYVWTSQVADPQFAKPALPGPGPAHTVTVGTGYGMGSWMFDGAFEYTWLSGDGGSSPASVGTRLGSYEVKDYTLHLGASYAF